MTNSIIKRPAALVKQGDLTLYTTSLKVSDLLTPSFYSVETLDPEDGGDKGYQRLLNKARAKKLAGYIIAGQETKDAFLPTSIFIATDKNIPFFAFVGVLHLQTSLKRSAVGEEHQQRLKKEKK